MKKLFRYLLGAVVLTVAHEKLGCSTLTLEKLPIELKYKIAEYLNKNDLLSLGCTSSAWNQITWMNRSRKLKGLLLKDRYDVQSHHSFNIPKVLSYLKQLNMQKIEYLAFYLEKPSGLTKDIFDGIEQFISLQKLQITGKGMELIPTDFFEKFNYLQEFFAISLPLSKENFKRIKSETITTLKLIACVEDEGMPEEIARNLPNLKILELRGSEEKKLRLQSSLFKNISLFSKLQQLTLSFAKFNDQTIHPNLLSHLPIQKLDLSNSTLTKNHIIMLANIPSLQSLDLDSCKLTDNHFSSEWGRKLTRIKWISLEDNDEITQPFVRSDNLPRNVQIDY